MSPIIFRSFDSWMIWVEPSAPREAQGRHSFHPAARSIGRPSLRKDAISRTMVPRARGLYPPGNAAPSFAPSATKPEPRRVVGRLEQGFWSKPRFHDGGAERAAARQAARTFGGISRDSDKGDRRELHQRTRSTVGASGRRHRPTGRTTTISRLVQQLNPAGLEERRPGDRRTQ